MYVKGVLPLPKNFFEMFLAFVDAPCTTCLCAGAQQGSFSLSFFYHCFTWSQIYTSLSEIILDLTSSCF